MDPEKPRRQLSSEQKRMLAVLLVIAALIAVIAIGVGSVAMTIGVPFWISVIIAVTLAAVVGLFMMLNMI